MTLLAIWLGEECVALATDSRKGESNGEEYRPLDDCVTKLHCVPSADVMFAIGFGEEPSEWLSRCPCDEHSCYPEHWCECSRARSVEDLEKFIRSDLHQSDFDPEWPITLYVAGVNKHGDLEAFVLDGTGCRIKQLKPGSVVFSPPSLPTEVRIGGKLIEEDPRKLFESIEKKWEDEHVKCPGAKALEEAGTKIIKWCQKRNYQYIGGRLQYHVICGL